MLQENKLSHYIRKRWQCIRSIEQQNLVFHQLKLQGYAPKQYSEQKCIIF